MIVYYKLANGKLLIKGVQTSSFQVLEQWTRLRKPKTLSLGQSSLEKQWIDHALQLMAQLNQMSGSHLGCASCPCVLHSDYKRLLQQYDSL